jgi:hypothetical protein
MTALTVPVILLATFSVPKPYWWKTSSGVAVDRLTPLAVAVAFLDRVIEV